MTAIVADSLRARRMGPVLATFLVAGNMIGSGVYLLPATLASVGSVSVVGWVVAGAGAMLLAAVFSLLNRYHPTANGVVAYTSKALGRFLGFETAFAYWLCCVVGNLAIAVAVVGYISFFVPALKAPMLAAGATAAVIWVLTLANIVGPKFVGRIHGATLLFGLLPILAAGVLGWLWFDPDVFTASWNVTGKSDVNAVAASLVLVFWAFTGLESASVAAGVVRDPERNVPIATFAGVGLAAVVYILASAAVMGVLPAPVLAQSAAPFADVVARIAGAGAAAFVAACALFKASGTLGGWVLVTAETTRASAEAGFLPRLFAHTRADGVPVPTLVLLALMMTVIAVFTAMPTIAETFTLLINVSTNLALAVYGLCCLALLRFSGAMQAYRTIARVAAVAGLAFCVWVVAASDPELLKVQAWIYAVSLPLYAVVWWLGRRRAAAGDPAI